MNKDRIISAIKVCHRWYRIDPLPCCIIPLVISILARWNRVSSWPFSTQHFSPDDEMVLHSPFLFYMSSVYLSDRHRLVLESANLGHCYGHVPIDSTLQYTISFLAPRSSTARPEQSMCTHTNHKAYTSKSLNSSTMPRSIPEWAWETIYACWEWKLDVRKSGDVNVMNRAWREWGVNSMSAGFVQWGERSG
jgi:hypothetical protein